MPSPHTLSRLIGAPAAAVRYPLPPVVRGGSERRLEPVAADRYFRCEAAVSTCAPARRPSRSSDSPLARSSQSCRSSRRAAWSVVLARTRGQRIGIPRSRVSRRRRAARHTSALHPRRAPEQQRLRRARPADDPRGRLAPTFARSLVLKSSGLEQNLDEYLVDYTYDRARTGPHPEEACPQTSSTAHARRARR